MLIVEYVKTKLFLNQPEENKIAANVSNFQSYLLRNNYFIDFY